MNAANNDLRLVSHDLCPYVQRSVIVLMEKGIAHERVYIDLSDKPEWFRRISPLGKVPALRVGGRTLFESAVICEYLDEVTPGSLHPVDPLDKAEHRAWIEFGSSILNDIAGFYVAKDAETFGTKRAVIVSKWERLEATLDKRPYYAGETFSMVDAVYGPIFRYFDVFDEIDDFGFFEEMPKVSAWREALAARPSVRQAAIADYPARLMDFLKRRGSHLSSLIEAKAAA